MQGVSNYQCLLNIESYEWFLKYQDVQRIYEPCQKWLVFLFKMSVGYVKAGFVRLNYKLWQDILILTCPNYWTSC